MTKELIYNFDNNSIKIEKYEKEDFDIITKQLERLNSLTKEFREFYISFRAINIPAEISEALFCILINPERYVRFIEIIRGNVIKGDIFDLEENKSIEIKTKSSKEESPSSFSPKKLQSKIFIMDVSKIIKGKIKIGEIDIEKLENKVLNKRSGTTFLDQQKSNRRPRLTIKMRNTKDIEKQDILKNITVMDLT